MQQQQQSPESREIKTAGHAGARRGRGRVIERSASRAHPRDKTKVRQPVGAITSIGGRMRSMLRTRSISRSPQRQRQSARLPHSGSPITFSRVLIGPTESFRHASERMRQSGFWKASCALPLRKCSRPGELLARGPQRPTLTGQARLDFVPAALERVVLDVASYCLLSSGAILD